MAVFLFSTITILSIKRSWNWISTVGGVAIPNSKNHEKYSAYAVFGTTNPNFQPFRPTISRYHTRYCTFYDFPLTPMFKLFATFFFLNWVDCQKCQPVFPQGKQCPQKVWPRSDETCRSCVLKFPAAYGSVLRIYNFFFLNLFLNCQTVKK